MLKKLSLLLFAMMFVGALSAQNLIVTHEGQPIESGSTFEVSAEGMVEELNIAFEVVNGMSEVLTITCVKVEVSTVENTLNYFCWGQCLSPEVYESTMRMEPGVPAEFSAHYMPLEMEGITSMKYIFTDAANTEEFVININFIYPNTISVTDYFSNEVFSNAYPSPATDKICFDYDFPTDVNKAMVVIYNMMGQEVIRKDINSHFGQLVIDVNNLNDGIYFYSLVVNNKTVKSNKIIIH